jgi:hypothetical protein
MVSGLTRNQMPRKGLRVRIPCPPLPYARIALVADAGLPAEPGILPGGVMRCLAPVADAGFAAEPGIVPAGGA